MTYKYFFFDFDGMLCDSYDHTATAFVKTLKETRNIDIDYKKAYDLLKVTFKEAYDYFDVKEHEKEIFRQYHEDIDFKPVATLYPEVINLLKTIKESGGKSYIFTNRNETLYGYLKKFNILEYFEDFILEARKPDPKLLLDMVNKYNLPINQCVVVGDRSIDVDTAYNCNMDGILYDVDSRVFLHHGTYVIKRINELYDFIDVPYKIKNNYHTHTIRCGHAVGSDEQYVISAIENGYVTLGFSDHVIIPNINRNEEYFDSLSLLKEKYKEHIDIKIALEVEWYDKYVPYYKKLKQEGKVDYLILGNHGYLKEDGVSRADEVCFMRPYEDYSEDHYLKMYYKCLEKAVKSGLFKYIAHPDCFLKGYRKWDEKAIKLTHKIASLLASNNMYAEVNACGLRNDIKIEFEGNLYPTYPFAEFFKILKQYGVKFVLGCDAHAPNQLNDDAVKSICEMAKQLQLDVIYTLNDL